MLAVGSEDKRNLVNGNRHFRLRKLEEDEWTIEKPEITAYKKGMANGSYSGKCEYCASGTWQYNAQNCVRFDS